MHTKPGKILHSQAEFVSPDKPRSEKPARAIIVALATFGIAITIGIVSGDGTAFAASWALFFLIGWGTFVDGAE